MPDAADGCFFACHAMLRSFELLRHVTRRHAIYFSFIAAAFIRYAIAFMHAAMMIAY